MISKTHEKDCAMKQIHALISAATIAAVTALPALAQQTATRAGGENALQMAQRIEACGGAGISDAVFENNEALLRVTCRGGMAGAEGLSGGLGAAAAGIGAVALIALAADSDGSGSTTTTTTTTN